MKKLFFVSLFGLLLAACGGGDGDPDNKPKPDPDEPTRDTEQVWRTKALNAVEELEDIAERAYEFVNAIDDAFDTFDRNTDFDLWGFTNEIYNSEEYQILGEEIDSWQDKHKLDNYPITREQTYNQIIDLYDKALKLFRQTDSFYAEYWPLWVSDYDLSKYTDYKEELYNSILESIDNIRAAV